jgi:hypothetical protein
MDSCLRRNDTVWIPACAGMTRGFSHEGRGVLGSRFRGNDTEGPLPLLGSGVLSHPGQGLLILLPKDLVDVQEDQ